MPKRGIVGLADLRKTMKELGRSMATKVLPAAIDRGAEVLERAVRDELPVGDTGELVRRLQKTRAKTEGTRVSAEVYDDSAHAAAQEFGTSRMPANPAMHRAVERSKDRVFSVISAEVLRGLDREAKG